MPAKTAQPEIQNTPKLRFAGFSGAWGEKKLGEVATIERGRFSPRPRNNPKYYGGKIPFVQTGDVVKSGGLIKNYTQTINEEGLKVSKLFPKGTILITIAANIGYTGVLDIDMACPDSLIGIKCKDNTNNFFLNYYLSTQQVRMDRIASQAAQKNINIDFLKPYKIYWTSLPEQKNIADFLGAADEWIENLRAQKESLESYKKGMMQKLFPSTSSGQAPQIRFKDERGKAFPKWEEKKLGEVCNIKTGKKDVNEGNPKGQYPFFTCAKEYTYSDSYSFDCDAILIAGNGEVGHCQRYCGKFEAYQRTYVLDNFSLLSSYLFALLNSTFQEHVNNQKQMGAMPYIKLGMLKDFIIPVPSKEEQQKIADFLTSVDKVIESKQQQITQAETWKKGLMQGLFV